MDVMACFEALGPYIGHLHEALREAPLEAEDRAKLAAMVTASFSSVALDCVCEARDAKTDEVRQNLANELTSMLNASLKLTHKTQLNG